MLIFLALVVNFAGMETPSILKNSILYDFQGAIFSLPALFMSFVAVIFAYMAYRRDKDGSEVAELGSKSVPKEKRVSRSKKRKSSTKPRKPKPAS
jgi:hypothetical protein